LHSRTWIRCSRSSATPRRCGGTQRRSTARASWRGSVSSSTDTSTTGSGLLAVEDLETGEFLGDCGPTIQHVDDVPHVELGWHTRRDRWGQGIATEGGAACRQWCWANLDVDHVVSLIRPENRQSRRVAEKLGMTIWRETMRTELPHFVYGLDRS
jgi:RimJ/RimL family protein N-acetyltransferase